METVLSVTDLVYRYERTSEAAVRGLSFEVAKGEIFGLLGPNGAGKTTTLSMLAGLLAPTGGRVTISGLDVARRNREAKQRIGFVPQELAVYPTLTARENLVFFASLYGLQGARRGERVAEALRRVELTDRADEAVQTYSGGMKRRVNIAAGLLHEPDVLLLDEPTAGVDPQSRNFILDGVKQLAKDGLAVVFSTHYMEEAERICDRVAIVDHGRILAEGRPSELTAALGGGLVSARADREPDERIVETLRRLPGVTRVDSEGSELTIAAQKPMESLVGVIDALRAAGLNLLTLSYVKPNLESVFLGLTGKTLRD